MTQLFSIVGVSLMFGACLAAPERGAVVAPGVAEASIDVRHNGTDVVHVLVTYPSDGDGLVSGRSLPGLVMVQGGLVGTERYTWLARAMARRGFVVAMPEHPLQLAFFSSENGLAAYSALAVPPPSSLLSGAVDRKRVGVLGHSLGGVVAVKLALSGHFGALALLASFPDPADESRLPALEGVASLSMAAELDCSAVLGDVRDGWEKLPGPTALVRLPGATHFQFTNDDVRDRTSGCVPLTELASTHGRIEEVLGSFFKVLGGASLASLPLGPDEALVERR